MSGLKIVVLLISVMLIIAPLAASAETPSTKTEEIKKIEANATIDIGKDTKEILEKSGSAVMKKIEELARSLGMTVEKIYPFYIKQAYIKGLTSTIIWSGLNIFLFIICTVFWLASAAYNNKEKGDESFLCAVIAIIVLVISLIMAISICCYLSDWIASIKNPEYTAIHQLIQDASSLSLIVK
ncbi:MAG: hypothetical protein HY764_04145 [Candidatus Portnoybacteria bacterium]|nr:hypothetical protein [Candidatus Portnoybacteria bacterium]